MITRAVNLVEDNAIESAVRTISMERAGLAALETALRDGLSVPFCKAIETIGQSNGRLIITGVGKSGHIGAKLAATFASTGTPAFFVHAAEANHGDLGMIGGDDVVLAISKGGESAELRSIINYSRRFSIPLIALTCSETSSLAKASDIVLLVPNKQEACPLGLAPTTSTLMQLALGDALAVALLEARNFTAGDFKVFHPGGKLGASLTLVSDIMHTGDRVPLVNRGTAMPEAVGVLSRKHFGCVGVLDEDGRLCGIVTEGDMARNLSRNLAELTVDDIMTRTPKTVKKSVLATGALATLEKFHIGALIVVDDDNRPIGLVHFHDLLRIGVA
ncbi:UNVERIFIED_ORG: arabinose-5-phosphate isomerase [Rhizobium sp. SORGH_AS260]|uniref:KpsF/GutQ family sugar-phosphate isomerase n=1 Tax=Agrobacterium sp. SORGH_AS_0440 TaxID=3041757 RepID=UPI002783EEEC|nr:KpsF/GutQ family sugar-phosphate isomerase [Agrobacterium sp. SORGH_AS_0440]MDP9731149.1 arabinose-5-phosphate isomerase [Rhizobium sp. SORGH_AS_0285]MDP9752799.1 arabinose-5-phosphate isomerase [Rhizobium sp. SORGH_AS_0260]MDR6079765.1 arabinose-5-phosphate isomerase [Agrobacterium sp. SORGH_AS_0440]